MKKKLEELKALVLENDRLLLEVLRRLAELEKKSQELADAYTIRENCIKNMLDRLAELERWKDDRKNSFTVGWITNMESRIEKIEAQIGMVKEEPESYNCTTTNDKEASRE